MFDFNKPNIEITDISDDKKYGRFVVEPLERGYGTTLLKTAATAPSTASVPMAKPVNAFILNLFSGAFTPTLL